MKQKQSENERIYPIWVDFSNQPLSSKDVKVRMKLEFSRIEHPETSIRDSVSQTFSRRKEKNPMLYNGTKFRAHNARKSKDGKILEMDCAMTDYASYLGTNWNEKFVNLDRKYLSEPLGLAAILHTSCDKIVALRRSAHVGEYPNFLDVPGGHPEPKHVKGCEKWMDDDDDSLSSRIVHEFFNGALCEIRDEINVPIESISDLRLLGLVHHNQIKRCGSGPGLVFVAKTNLNCDDIKKLYKKGPVEAFESTSLTFFDTKTALQIDDTPSLRNQFSAKCRGAIALWTRYMRSL